eukprot:2878561-Amphidinium_carterae.1
MQYGGSRNETTYPTQRYCCDDDNYVPGSGADDETVWWSATEGDYPEEAFYNDDDNESIITTSSQWEMESRLDPYDTNRLSAEYVRASKDPAYAGSLFWAARRAIRKHRAATGRFFRRGGGRRWKGGKSGRKGGKSSHSKGKGGKHSGKHP